MTRVGALARIVLLSAVVGGGCARDRSNTATLAVDEPELEANQPIRHTTSRFLQTRGNPAVAAPSGRPHFLDQVMADQAQARVAPSAVVPPVPPSAAGPTLEELAAPDLGTVLAAGLSAASTCASQAVQVYSVEVRVDVSEYGRVLRSSVSGVPSAMEGCVARVAQTVSFPEARGQATRHAHAAMQLGRAPQPEAQAAPEPAIPLAEGARGASTTLSARAPSVHEEPPVGYVPPSRMLIPPSN